MRDYRSVSSGLTCVQPALHDAALDEYRSNWRALRNPEQRARYEPGFSWQQSTGYSDGSPPPLLDAEASRPLDEATTAIIRGEPSARSPVQLDRAWLDGIPFCGATPARSTLVLSAPVISGDLAFVETGYGCGALCGSGYLYALRRDGAGRWTIVGVTWTWVS